MLSASLKAKQQTKKKDTADIFECDPLWEQDLAENSQAQKLEIKQEAEHPNQKARQKDISSFNQLIASYRESSKESEFSQSLKNSPMRFFMYQEQRQEQQRDKTRGRSQSDITPNTTSLPIPIKTRRD